MSRNAFFTINNQKELSIKGFCQDNYCDTSDGFFNSLFAGNSQGFITRFLFKKYGYTFNILDPDIEKKEQMVKQQIFRSSNFSDKIIYSLINNCAFKKQDLPRVLNSINKMIFELNTFYNSNQDEVAHINNILNQLAAGITAFQEEGKKDELFIFQPATWGGVIIPYIFAYNNMDDFSKKIKLLFPDKDMKECKQIIIESRGKIDNNYDDIDVVNIDDDSVSFTSLTTYFGKEPKYYNWENNIFLLKHILNEIYFVPKQSITTKKARMRMALDVLRVPNAENFLSSYNFNVSEEELSLISQKYQTAKKITAETIHRTYSKGEEVMKESIIQDLEKLGITSTNKFITPEKFIEATYSGYFHEYINPLVENYEEAGDKFDEESHVRPVSFTMGRKGLKKALIKGMSDN